MKAELTYVDMRVTELARLSGVKKQTIDSYLREKGCNPSAEAAVRIAGALGVTVEYLVTGKETKKSGIRLSLGPDMRQLMQSLEQLDKKDRKIIIKNALFLTGALQDRLPNWTEPGDRHQHINIAADVTARYDGS